MNVVLVSLNAKYFHTNLAIRSIKKHCSEELYSVHLREFTINDREDRILGRLVEEEAEVYAFSIYIWNVAPTLRIMKNLKKIRPDAWIVAGGPEVSFLTEAEALDTGADVLVSGEGEKSFPQVLAALGQSEGLDKIPGITVCQGEKAVANLTPRKTLDMDALDFAYENEELLRLKGSIFYYESSRGCPYSCAYCMSSVEKSLRFKSLDRVKEELARFMDADVGLVKFVDRTFNCDRVRTKEILGFLLERESNTCFHFEVAADLLDEEILALLEQAPPGRFQLEVGIQTIHPATLGRINRKSDIQKVKDNVLRILAVGNIHVHLDLIAGLPGESMDQIATSFNEIMDLRPHMLQLGFLKLLKGSPMMDMVEEYGYAYQEHPPYEVLLNDTLPFRELWKLHQVEHVLDKYYNSGAFGTTLEMVEYWGEETAYDFYAGLANHWDKTGCFERKISKDALYQILLEYMSDAGYHKEMAKETLKMDYLLHGAWPVPGFLDPMPLSKGEVFDLLHTEGFVEEYLPEYREMPPKEIVKHIYVEQFSPGKGDPRIGIFSRKKTAGLGSKNQLRWLEDSC